MRSKTLNMLLLITSLVGFLEWGGGNHSFLFQVEAELVSKIRFDPNTALHPLILLPFIGQIALLITLFQRTPNKMMTFFSIGCLGILLGSMFVIGLMSLNFKMAVSTIPFIWVAVLILKRPKK